MSETDYFVNLGTPQRIWAISSVNGHTDRLNALHREVWDNFKTGDKIVYLGNYLGNPDTPDNPDVVDSINLFRDALISHQFANTQDIICLKGSSEDMWMKLLQLQFAKDPIIVLEWLLKNGMEGMLNHYGSSGAEGMSACRSGLISLIRWTNMLRQNMREKTGHDNFYKNLKRAAYNLGQNNTRKTGLLFVHAGLDPQRTMNCQSDNFWWGHNKFETIQAPYGPFRYVVRGYDPKARGIIKEKSRISLDGRDTDGHAVTCARFSDKGELLELYTK